MFALSAEIICFAERVSKREEAVDQIDLRTAVDAAIRDLREIEATWGTRTARERLSECGAMLQAAFAAS
jgi:hypothetical protein